MSELSQGKRRRRVGRDRRVSLASPVGPAQTDPKSVATAELTDLLITMLSACETDEDIRSTALRYAEDLGPGVFLAVVSETGRRFRLIQETARDVAAARIVASAGRLT